MVEIGIHPPQPSPHPAFWVEGGENFGSGSLRSTPRLSLYRLIQPFHISSTLPICHYKHNEWLYMVQIGVWAPKCLPQPIFRSWVGTNLAWPANPLFAPRLSMFRLIQAIRNISTLPIIHHKYIKWLDMFEIWIHLPQPSPHPDFWVTGGETFGSRSLCLKPTLSM